MYRSIYRLRLLANQFECPIRELRYYPAARMCVPLECCHSPGSGIDVLQVRSLGGRDIHGWRCHWSSSARASRYCACANLGLSFTFSPNIHIIYLYIYSQCGYIYEPSPLCRRLCTSSAIYSPEPRVGIWQRNESGRE